LESSGNLVPAGQKVGAKGKAKSGHASGFDSKPMKKPAHASSSPLQVQDERVLIGGSSQIRSKDSPSRKQKAGLLSPQLPTKRVAVHDIDLQV
jgi:hypothetical protein